MRTLQLAITAIIFSAASAASAFNIDAKIVKASKDTAKVIVSTTDTSNVETKSFLSLGANCELEVVKVSKNRIILDSSICEETKFLTEGRDVILVGTASVERDETRSTDDSSNSTRTRKIYPKEDLTAVVASGFRMSLSTSTTKAEEESDFFGALEYENETAYSFGVGYTNIGVRSVGFIGDLVYTHYGESSLNALRTSGSVAFGFTKKFYGYIGANLNFYTNSGYNDFDPVIGNQLGLGFQVTELVGFNLARITTRNSDDRFSSDIDLRVDATELGMTLTF